MSLQIRERVGTMVKKKSKAKKTKGSLKRKTKKVRVRAMKRTIKRPLRKTKGVKKSKPAVTKASSAEASKIQGTLVGKVTHYFPQVNAAVVKIKTGEIQKGDELYFKGHTTDFKQTITSLQIDHVVVESAGRGKEVGVEVKDRVREDDRVYKLNA